MELRQAEYVVAVIEEGGFTRAAAKVHVAQPTLSQGIRTLERELGVALFHRLGRRVGLTPAGEAFEGPARQMLRDAENVRQSVAAVRGLQAGRLDLVALPTLAVDPLVHLVGRFRREHPQLTVRMIEPDDAPAVFALVRDGRCEIGLAELPAPSDLTARSLGWQEIMAVCPPGTIVGPEERLPLTRLAEMPIVATPRGTSTRRLVDAAFASAGLSVLVAVETAQRETILPLVLAGAGTTFLPAALATDAASRGAVIAPVEPCLRREIGLVHRTGTLAPAAAAFVSLAARVGDGDGV